MKFVDDQDHKDNEEEGADHVFETLLSKGSIPLKKSGIL